MSASLRLSAEILELRTRHPFIIARGGQSDYRTVWVRLTDGDGREGWGEAAADQVLRRDGRDRARRAQHLRGAACPTIRSTSRRPSAAGSWRLRGNPAARAALSAALHDLAAQRPACRCTGSGASIPRGRRSPPSPSASTPARRCGEGAGGGGSIPILKIKLGTDRDVEILRAIRDATDREIRVDANCGWTAQQAIAMLPVLKEFGVTVLEQPRGARRTRRLRADPPRAPTSRSSPTRAARPPPTSRRWWARWTASTSSSPSAAACARRSA